MVLDVDAENKRISLGMKQLHDDPWPAISERLAPGVEPQGKVVRVQDKGVVVDLGDDIEGFVPVSHSGVEEAEKLEEYYGPGDAVSLRILESDAANRRIVLEVTEKPERKSREEIEAARAAAAAAAAAVEAASKADDDEDEAIAAAAKRKAAARSEGVKPVGAVAVGAVAVEAVAVEAVAAEAVPVEPPAEANEGETAAGSEAAAAEAADEGEAERDA
jgi:small subunit ribosomal protein S1